MTSSTLSYRGYAATVQFDARDGIFWGKVLGLVDRITFEGKTVEELTKDFQRAIDFYLEDCANTGRTPEKPLSGELLFTSTRIMHGRGTAAARAAGKSPDQWAAEVFGGAEGR